MEPDTLSFLAVLGACENVPCLTQITVFLSLASARATLRLHEIDGACVGWQIEVYGRLLGLVWNPSMTTFLNRVQLLANSSWMFPLLFGYYLIDFSCALRNQYLDHLTSPNHQSGLLSNVEA